MISEFFLLSSAHTIQGIQFIVLRHMAKEKEKYLQRNSNVQEASSVSTNVLVMKAVAVTTGMLDLLASMPARKGKSDLWVVQTTLKDELKCAWMVVGEQYVMIYGVKMMLGLHVKWLASLGEVSSDAVAKLVLLYHSYISVRCCCNIASQLWPGG